MSPYRRFPRIPRWRRELKITLPALTILALAAVAVKVILQL